MKNKRIIILVKYLAVLTIFFFIIRFLYLNIESIKTYPVHFDYLNLLYASILYFFFAINNTIIWYLITKLNQCHISLPETIKIRIYSEFGKYIPGKVFIYGIVLFSYEKRNISMKKIAICSFQELVISTLATILISLISIVLANISEFGGYKLFLIFILILCLFILHPKVLLNISNFFFKLLKKEPIETPFSFGHTLFILILYIMNWFIFGLSFYFFINSIIDFSLNNLLFSTGAFALSALAGFLAVFAPAGLGVREGALIFLLSFAIPATVASIISIASRVWLTLADIFIFLVIFFFSKFQNCFFSKHP